MWSTHSTPKKKDKKKRQVSYGGCYVYVLKYEKKINKFKQSLSNFEPWNGQYFKQLWGMGPSKVAYI